MIDFAQPWFLLGIPLCLLAFLLTRRWRHSGPVTRPKIRQMFGPDGERPARLGSGLIGTLGLCFLLTALARPQWGHLETQTFEKSRQVVIGLDLSRSMLGTDVTPSRLERARLLLGTLLRELRGERVGLVVFAGTAFIQMPLTNDYEIMRELLKELHPNFLPEQGTNFHALLATAYQAFDHQSTADKFLIILSDGEDVVGNWRPEMAKLRNAGVRIITLGLATPEGSLLPDGEGGFIKDPDGAVVLSRLDETVLRELAETTNGLYQPATGWVDLRDLLDRTVALGQTGTFHDTLHVTKIERFQIPLAISLLFLLVSLWTDFPAQPSRRALRHTPRSSPARTPAASATLTALLLLPLPLLAQTQPPLPDLPGFVAQLSQRPKLTPQDYAHFA
ncbi:MAG: VWA domain-containing protein, partial [Verrucomicrobiia bacterium]